MSNVHRINDWGNRPQNILPPDGGGPYDGGMDSRVTALEVKVDRLITDVEDLRGDIKGLRGEMKAGFDRLDAKMLTEWSVARVVFFVVGALGAAAIFGPRLVSIFGAGQ